MPEEQTTKRCSKCKATKPRGEFHPRRRSKDGLQSNCKACNRKAALAWNKAHPGQRERWRSENKGKERATCAAWRRANPKKVSQYLAKYSRNNPAKMRQKCARRRALKKSSAVSSPRELAAFYRLVRTADRITCHWCGKPVKKGDRHVDHIVPLARGGAHAVLNLCCSCSSCNHRKRSKLPAEFTGQNELFCDVCPQEETTPP